MLSFFESFPLRYVALATTTTFHSLRSLFTFTKTLTFLLPTTMAFASPLRTTDPKRLPKPLPKPKASGPFDIVHTYKRYVKDSNTSMPIAALLSLSDLINESQISTMFELMEAVKAAADTLKQGFSNSIAISAGCDLFFRFVSSIRDTGGADFDEFKREIKQACQEYAQSVINVKETIARHINSFIKDDSIILTHAYSRVVINAILAAHRSGKRVSVYVTEARPRGLGLKTQELLAANGIPCTVILDSAVAYAMDKVDMVLVGCEAVVESGGIVNAVGSCQIAIVAKAYNKPVHVLAESYKFTRLFPISSYDLPTHKSQTLSFPSVAYSSLPGSALSSPTASAPGSPRKRERVISITGAAALRQSTEPDSLMHADQLRRNPEVDYTGPEWITLICSDAGILTPEGVSSYLVTMSLRSELS